MSCGGNARTNRNAAAIQAALAAHPGTLAADQGRQLFHRLADDERARILDRIKTEHGRPPTWQESRDATQAAHAHARARLDAETAAIAGVLAANQPNTDAYARQAADWAARDPRTAQHLTPDQAAAEVRRIRRHETVAAFTRRHGGTTDQRAAAATDPRPDSPDDGGGQHWLAIAVRDRAENCGTPQEQDARAKSKQSAQAQARWHENGMPQQERDLIALSDRLRRAAKLESAVGGAQRAGAEDWDQAVDHNDPYGPGLQARWDALSYMEKAVLSLRAGAPHGDPNMPPVPHTLDQIAARLGTTRERVRSLQARAEAKLRDAPRPT